MQNICQHSIELTGNPSKSKAQNVVMAIRITQN